MEANSPQIIPAKKRSKSRRWVPTPAIDAVIRRLYAERVGRTRIPCLKEFARKIGWPDWAVKKRGQELGLARTKETEWTEKELAILFQWAWQSDNRIRIKLQAAGFRRTATAIHLKLKRIHAKENGDWYSANGLAGLFGCDNHCITGWIKRGYLRAKPRGTARTEQQGGDAWLILHRDVRQFVAGHPTEFDLRKVDQLWFIDLLINKKGGL
jgi:hypothetical protein